MNSGVAELAGGSTCGSKALDGVSVPFRALTDGLKGRGFAATRQPLQAMYSVAGGKHFLDGFLLCWIQELAGASVVGGVLLPHDRFDCGLALLHVLDGRKLLGNGIAGRELPSGIVLLAGRVLKLSGSLSLLEVVAYLAVSKVAHAAPQGVAHDVSLIGDRLALEVAALSKADSILNPFRDARDVRLLLSRRPCPCFNDDAIRLIAELGRKLPVGCEYLGGCVNLFLVASGVGGDLRRLRPGKSALFEVLANLLAAWAGSVEIFLCVSFYLRRPTSPRRDFVPQPRQPIHQLTLIHGCRELLAVEITLWLDSAGGTVRSFGHIEDDGVGVELRSGIAIDGTRGIVLKLRSDEFPGGLGGAVAADPRLGIPLQFREGGCHRLPVGLADPVVAAHQRSQ